MRNQFPLASVCTFFVLLLLASIPFWLLGSAIGERLLPGLPVSSLMVVCPAAVAAFLVYRESGNRGVRGLFTRALECSNMRVWVWLVALGMMPLVMGISGVLLTIAGTTLPAVQIDVAQVFGLFLVFFLAATAEELGWTSFVTAKLLPRRGILLIGLIIGLVSVLWHLLPLLQAGRSWDWIAWWALGTMARRLMIVWLYVRGGQRVLSASLFHAMSNLSWMLFPVMGSHYDPKVTACVLVALVTPLLIFDNTK